MPKAPENTDVIYTTIATCPECGSRDLKVNGSRTGDESVKRFMLCRACGHRFINLAAFLVHTADEARKPMPEAARILRSVRAIARELNRSPADIEAAIERLAIRPSFDFDNAVFFDRGQVGAIAAEMANGGSNASDSKD